MMGWSERTEFFERLVALRVRYRTEREAAGFLTLEDAMIYAEAVLEASALEDEPWVLETQVEAGASTAGSGRGRTVCTVSQLRQVLVRWPDVAGSAGLSTGLRDHSAD